MVSPASTDLGNSETVKIAWECDREKQRTLCVITKADLASEGFADQILTNSLDLKLGTFIVRNWTQDEVKQKLSFEEARMKETQMFLTSKEL